MKFWNGDVSSFLATKVSPLLTLFTRVVSTLALALQRWKLWSPKSPKKEVAILKFHKAIKQGKNACYRQIAKKASKTIKMAIKCIFTFLNCLTKFWNGDVSSFLATKVLPWLTLFTRVVLTLVLALQRWKLWSPKSPKKEEVAILKFHKAIKQGKNACYRQIAKNASKTIKMAIKCISTFLNCLMKFWNGDFSSFLVTKVLPWLTLFTSS